jgi:dGTPase
MKNTFYNDFDTANMHPSVLKRKDGDYRSPFQIDRDRIIFSYVFRRLQSKTQLFRSGDYDFYRTRLTHSIEVARVCRSICDYLKAHNTTPLNESFFIDPDLTEAIGLAHDLGHPPFGHIGERELNKLMAHAGGFEGNAQTLRIVTELMYERKDKPMGMNPTRAFLDGILKYKKLHKECFKTLSSGEQQYPQNHFIYNDQEPYRNFVLGDAQIPDALKEGDKLNEFKSIECQVMDWADDTSYSLHDVIDGIKLGFINQSTIEAWAETQQLNERKQKHLEILIDAMRRGNIEPVFSNKLGTFIQACSLTPTTNFLTPRSNRFAFNLTIDPDIKEECEVYKSLAVELIFKSARIQQVEFKGRNILNSLFKALVENYISPSGESLMIIPSRISHWIQGEKDKNVKLRRLCDFLGDLTDKNAIKTYKRLFDPEYGSITDIH